MARHIELDPDTWWPAASRFEVVVGAILVQNTAWGNVVKAVDSLRAAGCLSVEGIRQLSLAELGRLIRSAGFWRQKAVCLAGLVSWLDAQYGGNLDRLFAHPTALLREQLLTLRGIGEETADAILLFAGDHASLVMDAYTRRLLLRHHLPATRAWVESELPAAACGAHGYRQWHALVVETAKRYCRKRDPDCEHCPLGRLRPAGAASPVTRGARAGLGRTGSPAQPAGIPKLRAAWGEHKRNARHSRAGSRAKE